MSDYRLVTRAQADLDADDAVAWYENERPGLGLELIEELRTTFDRIVEGPFKYPHLRPGARRALLRRFPYAVYFSVQGDVILVIAVVHTSRDSEVWRRRIR